MNQKELLRGLWVKPRSAMLLGCWIWLSTSFSVVACLHQHFHSNVLACSSRQASDSRNSCTAVESAQMCPRGLHHRQSQWKTAITNIFTAEIHANTNHKLLLVDVRLTFKAPQMRSVHRTRSKPHAWGTMQVQCFHAHECFKYAHDGFCCSSDVSCSER